jgi:hypothetical protein
MLKKEIQYSKGNGIFAASTFTKAEGLPSKFCKKLK